MTSASDPRVLASTNILHPQGVRLRIEECCEPFDIPYASENPDGPRAREFHVLKQSLSLALYSRTLASVLAFTEQFGRFSPEEVTQLISLDKNRAAELQEHLESIRQCHVMIQYDSMALRLPDISDDLRNIVVTRMKGNEATLVHDMESFTHLGRGVGIVGAILLDQRSVFYSHHLGVLLCYIQN